MFCSLNLLFGNVLVAVVAVVCLSSLLRGLVGEHAHVRASESENGGSSAWSLSGNDEKMMEDLSDDGRLAERS